MAAELPAGAARRDGGRAVVLLDGDPVRAPLTNARPGRPRGIDDLHVLADAGTGTLARRAGCFSPAPTVWRIDGTVLEGAAADAVPKPHPAVPAPALDGLLVDADLEVVVEDGIVRGEVNGLETRAVHDVSTAGVPLDEPLLEVGVARPIESHRNAPW